MLANSCPAVPREIDRYVISAAGVCRCRQDSGTFPPLTEELTGYSAEATQVESASTRCADEPNMTGSLESGKQWIRS
jgi:hypothetical protein